MYALWGKKVNTYINKMQNWLSDLKISFKITLFYLLILIISIVISSLLYQQIYSNITLAKISDISVQTLYSISSNIDLMMENINNYSKMILANDDLQDLLRNGNIYSDLNTQRRASTYLYKLTQAIPAISSIYIFDSFGNKYSMGDQSIYNFKLGRIDDAPWYDEIVKGNGAYILKLNGGGAFDQKSDNNFISLIRIVRDIESIKPIGALIINISENSFINSYSNIVSNYKTDIILLDENNERIIKSSDINKYDLRSMLDKFINKKYGSSVENFGSNLYLVSYLKENRYGWKIASIMPFKELSNESVTMALIGFIIILINSMLLFIGSIFISRMLTIPIKKLLKSMKGIEKGEFKEVEINTGDNEIGKLRDGYNIMICEIQKLLKSVIEEQKIKRKAELNVLQAQIKPHFLYNTLDSINSLALSERIDDVCNLVDALGSYYRISLSKGREIISIGEEIDMVKNYLTIQQIRYGNMFSVYYDIDDRVKSHKILKLVLQPLVENALYHGIRAKGETGTINISAKYCKEYIYLVVQDDGVGMSEEYVSKLLEGETDTDSISFGVRGTIERLRIFYGVEDIFKIASKIGWGTKVTITIPVGRENENVM